PPSPKFFSLINKLVVFLFYPKIDLGCLYLKWSLSTLGDVHTAGLDLPRKYRPEHSTQAAPTTATLNWNHSLASTKSLPSTHLTSNTTCLSDLRISQVLNS